MDCSIVEKKVQQSPPEKNSRSRLLFLFLIFNFAFIDEVGVAGEGDALIRVVDSEVTELTLPPASIPSKILKSAVSKC